MLLLQNIVEESSYGNLKMIKNTLPDKSVKALKK